MEDMLKALAAAAVIGGAMYVVLRGSGSIPELPTFRRAMGGDTGTDPGEGKNNSANADTNNLQSGASEGLFSMAPADDKNNENTHSPPPTHVQTPNPEPGTYPASMVYLKPYGTVVLRGTFEEFPWKQIPETTREIKLNITGAFTNKASYSRKDLESPVYLMIIAGMEFMLSKSSFFVRVPGMVCAFDLKDAEGGFAIDIILRKNLKCRWLADIYVSLPGEPKQNALNCPPLYRDAFVGDKRKYEVSQTDLVTALQTTVKWRQDFLSLSQTF